MMISLYMSRNSAIDGTLVFTPSTIAEIHHIGSIDGWVAKKSSTFKNLKKPKLVSIIYSNSDLTPPITIFYILKINKFYMCDHLPLVETENRKQRNRLGLEGVVWLNSIISCMPTLKKLPLAQTEKYINFSSKMVDIQSVRKDRAFISESSPSRMRIMEGTWKIRKSDLWIGSTIPFFLL